MMIGIFLVSVNIFSAQLWSQTCKKLSPIVYEENIYFRESKASREKGNVYLPHILKTRDDFGSMDVSPRAEDYDQVDYGTFAY